MNCRKLIIIFCVFAITGLAIWLVSNPVNASPVVHTPTFIPDTNITIEMYELFPGGDSIGNPCTSGNKSWGCTAFCNNPNPPYLDCVAPSVGYPYSSSTVSIPIESYYLLNVVSQEMNPIIYTENVALQAQVIAARSYAHYQIENVTTPPFNNSNSFQVFVPYKFDSLNPASNPIEPNPNPCNGPINGEQQEICLAVTPQHYLAAAAPTEFVSPDNDKPAFAEFSSDITGMTIPYSTPTPFGNQHPYLKEVEEPISQENICDANTNLIVAHGRGMSQEGAVRWARGHQCAVPGYSVAPGTPEPTPGQPWSVQWDNYQQILFHYYTGVHLRDAANGNAVLSPDHRWNPLQITWKDEYGDPIAPPEILDPTQTYYITFQVQNTGLYRWASAQDACFDLHWFQDAIEAMALLEIGTCEYPLLDYPTYPGDTTEVTVTIDLSGRRGSYRLRFEMARMNGIGEWELFSYIDPDRPWFPYYIDICVDECGAFLPAIFKNYPPPTNTPWPTQPGGG